MQRLEVSGAVRPIYGSLGVKRLILNYDALNHELKTPANTYSSFNVSTAIPIYCQKVIHYPA